DTLAHVVRTMRETLETDAFHPLYQLPSTLSKLLERGSLGQKSGAGFYKKVGKQILRLDPSTLDYVPAQAKADEAVAALLKITEPAERMRRLRESKHPQAQFLWATMRDVFQYAAVHLGSIAHSARDVDLAMRWGYGWGQGPFEAWQAAGWAKLAGWVKQDIDSGQALSSA